MENIRVAIFEDNKHLRESLYYLINGTPGFSCTGAYPDCNDAVFQITKDTPDVILMDIEMPGLNGIQGVKLIKSKFPQVHVLMQTIFHDENNIFDAICAGASGYILKSTTPAEYITAIKDVYNGGSPMTGSIARKVLELFQKNIQVEAKKDYQLTPKEKEMLQFMVQGKSFKMIAEAAGISYETVRTHMKNIYAKLHVNSNTEAVSKVLKEKLLSIFF
ncbi:MAG: response regulator transcription factor [Chitinophagales bacterium]|jgi:DNA-binding NarL/FixJ family response regulator|nr:response regulator transcription factor [Bacteroidota bacterium]MBK9555700.1 response regulator transcription factor [Bacteroidota bacterium]MBL0280607.1 response regulator transcription factor [Bacteroidota bacterium]MBP9880515.1 response regulator transcription factor [Chitinophagales bacterium]